MSYTASALSFMLENLGKSVIITGSQIPLFEPRSDGRENLLNALIIAGNYIIPEVTLLFNNKLFRGNRTTKHSASNMDAFGSPNLPPLATIGMHWTSLVFKLIAWRQTNRTTRTISDVFMIIFISWFIVKVSRLTSTGRPWWYLHRSINSECTRH